MNFEPKCVRRWRREVWRAFEREGFKPCEINAAMVLAACASFGTDPTALQEITGLSTGYVVQVLRRLRKQGILRGQTISAAWAKCEGADSHIGYCLEAGVAAGLFTRSKNPTRSAAQKNRAASTRATGPRRPRTKIAPGAVFTPALKKADALYGLPEWETKSASPQTAKESK